MRRPRRCFGLRTAVALLAVLACLAQIVSLTSDEWIETNTISRIVSRNSSALHGSLVNQLVATVLRSSLSFHCGVWTMCKENHWRTTMITVNWTKKSNVDWRSKDSSTHTGVDSTCSFIEDGVFVLQELDININVTLNSSEAIMKALAARAFGLSSLLLGSSATFFLCLTHSRCVTAFAKQQLLFGASSLFFVQAVFQAGSAATGKLWMREIRNSLPADIRVHSGWAFRMVYSMSIVFTALSALSLLAGQYEKYSRYTHNVQYSWDGKSEFDLTAPLTGKRAHGRQKKSSTAYANSH